MNNMNSQYTFPAIFSFESDGIAVSFPDLPGCLTCGSNQEEAVHMAKDVLLGYLYGLAEDNEAIPEAGDFRAIELKDNEVIVLVEADLGPEFNKTIRKNLTIPERLARRADIAGINYSQVLAEALEAKLKSA